MTFFRAVETLPSKASSSQYDMRGVCRGFCYDPKAGLGYRAENQRCLESTDGKEHCY